MYPQNITPDESELNFKLTEIENPLKHLSNDPWTHTTQDKVTAVAIIISEEKRILKVAQDKSSSPFYSYQKKDGEQWLPKKKFYTTEEVKVFLSQLPNEN
ncbi:MAG: hypothetical protein Q8K98_06570 [Bacteroidota bacterium]|nr:hypothetical protein [Bacteroidota bacterium]